METNLSLIRLAISILIIFGGTFTIVYFRTGDLLIGQMIGVFVGLVLFISALTWRKINKYKQG